MLSCQGDEVGLEKSVLGRQELFWTNFLILGNSHSCSPRVSQCSGTLELTVQDYLLGTLKVLECFFPSLVRVLY